MSDKPNILWLFSDQHRAQAMSCYGDENISTPNIDRLAREGTRFTNAFCNTPLCAPFRASLYFGKYINNHGVVSLHIPPKPGQRMLPQELQDAGYYTSHMGKWHLCGGECPCHFVSPYFRPGWDEWLGWENSNRPFNTEYSIGSDKFPEYIEVRKLSGYQTDAITDLTVEWIKTRKDKTPWFHVVAVEPPHPPYEAPEEYMRMFEDKEFKLRPNVPRNKEYLDLLLPKMRGYYAEIANLDYNIGRILNVLEETGQLDNTIIFYFSDHGELMGSHGKMEKSLPELESVNIPLIIRYPEKVPMGKVSDALFSCVDFMPTLLGMVGAEIPSYAEGSNLSSTVFGLGGNGAACVLIQFDHPFYKKEPESVFRELVSENWVYVCSLTKGPFMLFDMEKDPYQMNNLINNHEYDEIRIKLHHKLKEKLDEIKDDFMQQMDV